MWLGLRVGLASFVVAALFSGSAARADDASCRAYAQAAVNTVAMANANACGYGGGRWTPDYNAHYNACMDWSKDTRNGGMAAMNETAVRASDLAKCMAIKAKVEPPFSTGEAPFRGDDPPNLEYFCRAYAYIAQRQAAANLGSCKNGGGRWTNEFDQHLNACISWGTNAGDIASKEINIRTQELIACEVKKIAATPPPPPPPPPANNPPAGGGQPVSVDLSVDIYDQTGGNGNQIGVLEAGTQGVVLLEPCQNNWCHVQFPGGSGFVYSGPDYQSLK